MTNYTDNITVTALRQWMLAHQDDFGCQEAAYQIGEFGAIPVLIEMLGGPLTPRCALAVVEALGSHADTSHLSHLYHYQTEFSKIAFMIRGAIDDIVANDEGCTCGQCHDTYDDASGPNGAEGPAVPPFSRN